MVGGQGPLALDVGSFKDRMQINYGRDWMLVAQKGCKGKTENKKFKVIL